MSWLMGRYGAKGMSTRRMMSCIAHVCVHVCLVLLFLFEIGGVVVVVVSPCFSKNRLSESQPHATCICCAVLHCCMMLHLPYAITNCGSPHSITAMTTTLPSLRLVLLQRTPRLVLTIVVHDLLLSVCVRRQASTGLSIYPLKQKAANTAGLRLV